jgi:hypothetical protein
MFGRTELTRYGTVGENLDDLVLDLLEWLGSGPRPYAEVLDAWRTSCPRLPVWEEANDRGFIRRSSEPGRGRIVSVSAAGCEYVERSRPCDGWVSWSGEGGEGGEGDGIG